MWLAWKNGPTPFTAELNNHYSFGFHYHELQQLDIQRNEWYKHKSNQIAYSDAFAAFKKPQQQHNQPENK